MDVKMMLEELEKHYRLTTIERSLGLPFGSLEKMKTEKVPAAGIALIKIIHTFPWMIDVADNNFNSTESKKALVINAIESVKKRYGIH